MDILNSYNIVTNVGESAIIAIIVSGFTQLIKKTPLPNWSMPLVAMLLGAIVGVAIAPIYHDSNLANAGLYGFLVGGFASGVFQFIKGGALAHTDTQNTINVITPTNVSNGLQKQLDTNKNVLQSQTAMKDEPQQIK